MPVQRPPAFQVTSGSSPAGGTTGSGGLDSMSRQTSLLPGEVATPAARPTPLVGDWYRADSNLWESKDGGDQSASMTPLNSYGRQDLWKLPADDGDVGTTAAAGDGNPLSASPSGAAAVSQQPHSDVDYDDVDAAARVQQTLQQALGNDSDGHGVAASSFQVVSGHATTTSGAASFHSQLFFQRPNSHIHHHHHHHAPSGPSQAVPQPYPYLAPQLRQQQQQPQSQYPTTPSPPLHLPFTGGSVGAAPTVRFTLLPTSETAGSMLSSSSVSTTPPQHRSQDSPGAGGLGSRQSSNDAASLLSKYRSQSEIISDELYFQAKTFPPPPPPNPPAEGRRVRAELWYLTARKWDITQQLPPPPRSPLPGMEEEHRLKLQPITRVPYRGDRWLAQSERWFQWIQNSFPYPEENEAAVIWNKEDVLAHVA